MVVLLTAFAFRHARADRCLQSCRRLREREQRTSIALAEQREGVTVGVTSNAKVRLSDAALPNATSRPPMLISRDGRAGPSAPVQQTPTRPSIAGNQS